MKKICLLICCILILQMLCSCGSKKDDIKEPVNFYYSNKEVSYNSPTGVIQAEKREGALFHGDLEKLLQAYLLGPASQEMQSLIPSDVSLVSCEIDGDSVRVVMSSQFSKLSGVKLSAACSAILMTISDYTGVQTMQISAENAQLDDKDELIITMDDIVLMDTVRMEK